MRVSSEQRLKHCQCALPGNAQKAGNGFMKYIIFEDFAGQETPILFPSRILHEEMRDQIPYARVVSAGQVEVQEGRFVCRGKAKTLKTAARPEDSKVILEHFQPDPEPGTV